MSIFETIGIVCIVGGVLLFTTGTGAVIGLPTIINGIILVGIGRIYRTVQDIQRRIR